MINFIHFLTGSQLYGMTNPQSDYDYLVINNSDNPYPHSENKEVEVWSRDLFMVKLVDHDLKALEVYFSNQVFIRMHYDLIHKLNKSNLRRSVSAVCSNAHVKAKKKIRDGEIYIGLKSYWHTIRILTMYTDLAKFGTFNPKGYKEQLNPIYEDIISMVDDPEPETLFKRLVKKYDPLTRELLHEFRLLCPLEGN